MNRKTNKTLPDRHLVKEVLAGNSQAFETIMNSTKGLVAQITFKLIQNSEDRRDIAQEVYMKAFKDVANFEFRCKLSTWIGQIAYNTCLHYLEKKKMVLLEVHQDEAHDRAADMISRKSDDEALNVTQSMVFHNETKEILTTLIETLQPLYRTLIGLYHSEGLSYAEIGQITALPEGTVKNYLFRARQILRQKLLRQYKIDKL